MNKQNKYTTAIITVILSIIVITIYVLTNPDDKRWQTQVQDPVETTLLETTEAVVEETNVQIDPANEEAQRNAVVTPETTTDNASSSSSIALDPNIYRVDIMKEYGKDDFDPSAYDSVEEIVEELIDYYDIYYDGVSIAYYNFNDGDYYGYNDTNFIVAASTAKVIAVMAYIDLIEQGVYSYDTELLYNDYFNYEGAGNIANSPAQVSYSISDLMAESIMYSDNTAWYTLVFNYPNNFGGIANYALEKTGDYNVPEFFYMDNYGSASLYTQILYIAANNPSYEYLIQLMRQTDPPQLFTSYIQTDVIANKYGRVDDEINDVAIYYENDLPQYSLVAFTTGQYNADNFLEDLSLYTNMWFRYNYILN